jgi:WD40 repeat protein
MKPILIALLLCWSSAGLFAVTPQFWEENTQAEFAKGDPQSISINSDGELLLAPQLKRVYEGKDPIIWKIVRDSSGNIYAGTGNEGRVIKIDTSGNSSVLLDTNELEVQAMVIDKNGNLFVATSPDGKIYKVRPDGKSSVFFDPDDKYIWSLALDPSGELYAGTGDQGRIYRIDKAGKGQLLIDTNEDNITALCWGPGDSLLAGSDKNGILYAIERTGKAFVLFDSDLQQITAIYATPAGDVFFSAIAAEPAAATTKLRPEEQAKPMVVTPPTGQDEDEGSDSGQVEVVTSVDMTSLQVAATAGPEQTPPGVSFLYKLNPDGYTEIFYSSAEDQILDIAGYQKGMILLSTGKKGKLISVDENKKSTILLKTDEEQVTSLLRDGQQVWAATANPGNIYQLVEQHSGSGVFYSDIKDTQTTSTWGRITWKAAIPATTTLSLSTRSGNTRTADDTWSEWLPAGSNPEGMHIKNPKARFVQWKAEFGTTDPAATPILKKVSIAYLQQNLRPQVLSFTIYPPGIVFRKQPIYGQESFAGLQEDTIDKDADSTTSPQPGFEMTTIGKKEIHKGFQTITWTAIDQNQDRLRYDVYYRGEDDKSWKVLARNLDEKVYAWDTQTVADGTYFVKIVASDSPSNPQELALTGDKESDSFDIDNSPPVIQVLNERNEKGIRVLEVQARDQFSPIHELRYSITPGEWILVFPEDSINDSPLERYRIELKSLLPHTTNVIFKCSDRVRNTTTIKYTLT